MYLLRSANRRLGIFTSAGLKAKVLCIVEDFCVNEKESQKNELTRDERLTEIELHNLPDTILYL